MEGGKGKPDFDHGGPPIVAILNDDGGDLLITKESWDGATSPCGAPEREAHFRK